MARPVKQRRVCERPAVEGFIPRGREACGEVRLSVDEYEVLRLMDYLGYTQEECAAQMGVARTTAQAVYQQARRKLADMLVNGRGLTIGGGSYVLCGRAAGCCPGACRRSGRRQAMRIAVTYENGQVFQHFGHSEQFKVYEVENGKVISSRILSSDGNGHGALAALLEEDGVDVLICGGIGQGARVALAERKIELYPGVSGDADLRVEELLAGKLAYNPDTVCSHHGHQEGHSCGGHGHGEGHSCGGHGEGHSCGGHGHGEGHSCGG